MMCKSICISLLCGDECLKCNCSLNATIIDKDQICYDNGQTCIIIFFDNAMNKSDCVGQGNSLNHKC